MNLKLSLFLALSIFAQTLFSQTKETCNDSTDDVLDLNTISKCTVNTINGINENTNKKEIKIQVTSRKRIVRKRQVAQGVETHNNDLELKSIKGNSSIIGSLDLNKEKIAEKLPFNHVEEIPLFKKCEKVPLVEQKSCFNNKISEHIRKHFVYPAEAKNKNIQGRVLTQFVIDEQGNITNLNLRGPYKGHILEEEAKRIIHKLPKLIPGKHNGKLVKVKYGVPINFKIPGKTPSNIKKDKVITEHIYTFNDVDQIPSFKSCKIVNDENCFNTQLVKHINKYFVYPEEAINKNIEGKVLIYFTIDKNGDIINIKTRAPKGCNILENATVKLFERIPNLTPGLHKGRSVYTKHVFPIDFKLN